MKTSDHLEDRFSDFDFKQLRRQINRWFRKHGRILPWRETRDPYSIWISEIMLQQTTVKAVVPYFERFTKRFPSLTELAEATEEEVLQHWEGLGYYSRGRNLRKAAIMICDKFAGEFPKSVEELQKLPGVGRYTAGAIRSFAFDLPAPIVEANTLRLYCRLLGYEDDPRSREGEKLLWAFADALQPHRQAGQVNQALMELGSQVCKPVDPDCPTCPIMACCRARKDGLEDRIPLKKARPKITSVVEATVAIERDGKFLIRQRTLDERWAGMWDFVRFPVQSMEFKSRRTIAKKAQLNREIAGIVEEISKCTIEEPQFVTEIRHSVTRYRIRLLCCVAQLNSVSKPMQESTAEFRWVTLPELGDLPMPITGRQFAEALAEFEPA